MHRPPTLQNTVLQRQAHQLFAAGERRCPCPVVDHAQLKLRRVAVTAQTHHVTDKPQRHALACIRPDQSTGLRVCELEPDPPQHRGWRSGLRDCRQRRAQLLLDPRADDKYAATTTRASVCETQAALWLVR